MEPFNKNEAGNKTYSDTPHSGRKSIDDVGTKLAVFDDVSVDSDGFYDMEITGPHAYSFSWLLFLQTTTSEPVYSHTFTIILVAIALIIVGAAMVALGRRQSRSQLVKPRSKPSHTTSP